MKQVIYIVLVLISTLLVSCYNDRETVVKKYPNAEIYNLDTSFEFLVIDSTGIYYVSCNNPFNSSITEERLIKKY